jgi:long-chain acyl-CoA synthetase
MGGARMSNEGPQSTGVAIGNQMLSADELRHRSLRAASGFAAAGIGRDDSVALLLRNDFPFLEASLGAGALGAHALPINWHSTSDELKYILAHSGAKAIVIHADLLPKLMDAIPAHVLVLVAEPSEQIVSTYSLSSPPETVGPAWTDWAGWRDSNEILETEGRPTVSSVIYTSGTTGRPKAVKRSPQSAEHHGKVVVLAEKLLGLRPGARYLVPGPLYHSAPNASTHLALQLGVFVAIQPRFDPETFLALVEEHRITCTQVVPTMFVRLLKLPEAVRNKYDLSSLQHVAHSAAPCPPEVKREMIDWLGPVLYEHYGATETGAVTLCSSEEWLAHPGTVGRPLEDADVKILDDHGLQLPIGKIGDIYARLNILSDFTYEKDEDRRQEIESGGLVTVGDVGYFDEDGFLYICDRKNDVVIIGGSNVYPAEVEAALHQMPGVYDCAVFGVPDPDLGEALVAVVQLDPHATATADEVRTFLQARVNLYKVPRLIEFRSQLPREDSGKIFKRRLRDEYLSGGL